MGPLSAGPIIGALARDWRAAGIGLLAGIGITFLNAWLSDRIVDPWIARFQKPLQKGIPRVVANIAALAWAVILCAIAMLAPLSVLGSAVLTQIR
jgi:tetrahydromethanopterin S-methyltransferase subunit D